MKKQNRLDYLTLNSAKNNWMKTEEFKKLEYGREFVSEMRNFFTGEEMKVLQIYELEEKFGKFALSHVESGEFAKEIVAFAVYVDTLTERYKLKRFNPNLSTWGKKINFDNRTDLFRIYIKENKKRKVKTNDTK